jgi:RNA polymerase sigma factor (sigma-70 family)
VRSDAELIEAWRAGDVLAGDELVSRHFPAVSRFFRGKVETDPADLISQTFLACVESIDRIDPDTFRGFLFAVARRRLADHHRARTGGAVVDLSARSLADLRTGPRSRLARREAAELLREALAEIPLDDQIALELAYWEGLSGREIAAALGLTENTARSRLARARERLRAALTGRATAAEASLAEACLDPRFR